MIIEAIKKINPNAEVVITGEDINTCIFEWHNGTTPISKADIEAKMVEVQAEHDSKQYQRDRASQYPELKDQLDLLWHSIDRDAELKSKYFDFHQAILAVKAKHPK